MPVVANHRALVVSVAVHGVLFAALAGWLDDDDDRETDADSPPRDREPISIEPSPRPELAAMEVAILDGDPRAAPALAAMEVAILDGDPRAAAAPAPAAVAPAPGRASPPALASGVAGRAATDEPPVPARSDEPPRSHPLAMRGLRHDLSLPRDTLDRIAGGGPPPPERTRPTGLLRPLGRESRIDDPTATYTVRADGTVDIDDKDDVDIHWKIPLPTPGRIAAAGRALGDDIADWLRDPYRDTRVGTSQDLPDHLRAVPGSCDSYSDAMCDANPPRKTMKSMSGDDVLIPVLGGRADITSYLHRKFVGDPHASRKLKVLDSTRAERAERGASHRAAQLDRSAELMARNLDALWQATTGAAERREALFELWDECTEGDGPTGAAGARARAMVIGWIGAYLPRTGPDAYSDDELARLNARRSSRQPFAPY